MAAELTAEPEVEAVEPNRVRSASRVPNDASYPSQQPYLTRIGVPTAWDAADTGASTVVAVLDTGVDRDHPDLAPNLVAGRDIVNRDTDPGDDNGHGTAVAGVVGAVTGNGGGVAGVAWNAKIMPVKVLRADGTGFDADIASGIAWATDHGADIINMSLGGFGSSIALDQAVDYALAHDVIVVAAAGNESAGVPSFPAAIPGVLAVTATDAEGRFAWFSNHGPWVTLAAPGIGIVTTARAAGPTMAIGSGTGTSFSSPIVAGVAALVRERHPAWAWNKVAYELVRTARDAGPAGVDDAYGFGIVDAAAALDVGSHGTVAAPNLAGDASDLSASPRLVAVGAPVSEGLRLELDQDWFAFDVPAAAGAQITVTPPAFGGGRRAAEMDPVIELYGPGGGLVATADATLAGEPETIQANIAPGRHVLKVASYAASVSPADYGLRVDLGTAGPGPQPEGAGPWLTNAAPAPHARSIATATRPSITFGRDLLGSSVTNGTVLLLDGRTADGVDASVSPRRSQRDPHTCATSHARRVLSGLRRRRAGRHRWLGAGDHGPVRDGTGRPAHLPGVRHLLALQWRHRRQRVRRHRLVRARNCWRLAVAVRRRRSTERAAIGRRHLYGRRRRFRRQRLRRHLLVSARYGRRQHLVLGPIRHHIAADVRPWDLHPDHRRFRPQRLRRHPLVRPGHDQRLGLVLRRVGTHVEGHHGQGDLPPDGG